MQLVTLSALSYSMKWTNATATPCPARSHRSHCFFLLPSLYCISVCLQVRDFCCMAPKSVILRHLKAYNSSRSPSLTNAILQLHLEINNSFLLCNRWCCVTQTTSMSVAAVMKQESWADQGGRDGEGSGDHFPC